MKAKWKYKFAKLEFSKKLAITVTTLFIFCILFSLVFWAIEDRAPIEILDYVAAPFTVVVSGYFIKAGAENRRKIAQCEPLTEEIAPEEYMPHEQEIE